MGEKVKVLYVLDGKMSRGGTEAFIMNYFRHFDHKKIQLDIVQCGSEKGVFDEELKDAGSKLYYLPLKGKHPIAFSNGLKKICQKGKYQIVHGMMDTMNVWCLRVAKRAGVPVCIAHSHNTQVQSNNKLKVAFNNCAKKGILRYADYLMACSDAAGHWLFGEKSKFIVVKNGIDYDLLKFDEKKRVHYREQYELDEKFVIGHVGQFRDQKNHMFMLDVFSEMHKQEPKCHLVLIGTGPLLNDVENKIELLGLKSCVTIIKGSDKVNELLNMFDCYIFPSKFEGLGIALLEAEVNGLKCYASTCVPEEANIMGNVSYLSLEEDASYWAKYILDNRDGNNRSVDRKKLDDAGYDISNAASKLEDFYVKCIAKKQGK